MKAPTATAQRLLSVGEETFAGVTHHGRDAPMADRDRNTLRRLPIGERHPEPRARPSGQAEAFEPTGRRLFAPFAVREHHRAEYTTTVSRPELCASVWAAAFGP